MREDIFVFNNPRKANERGFLGYKLVKLELQMAGLELQLVNLELQLVNLELQMVNTEVGKTAEPVFTRVPMAFAVNNLATEPTLPQAPTLDKPPNFCGNPLAFCGNLQYAYLHA